MASALSSVVGWGEAAVENDGRRRDRAAAVKAVVVVVG